MKKILLLIFLISNLFAFNGCMKKIMFYKNDLIQKEILLNGKKYILYQSLNERAKIINGKIKILNDTNEGFLIFYSSPSKSKDTRLIATDEIIITVLHQVGH